MGPTTPIGVQALTPYGVCLSAFLCIALFFRLLWHLMRFGSVRGLLLTVKNLLIAPGGPAWGATL